MAISDKVKVGMVEYGVPATILVEFAAIAVLFLFALAFCKAASSADTDGADDWWGE